MHTMYNQRVITPGQSLNNPRPKHITHICTFSDNGVYVVLQLTSVKFCGIRPVTHALMYVYIIVIEKVRNISDISNLQIQSVVSVLIIVDITLKPSMSLEPCSLYIYWSEWTSRISSIPALAPDSDIA